PDTPTRAALHADPAALRARAERLRDALRADGCPAEVVRSVAVVGGGGAPGVELESWAVSLPEAYAVPLRHGDPPVFGRVTRGRLLLDLRCVPAAADDTLRVAVRRAAG
ncbi:L-seryl-tRNA(Sec) selenium transferase, partial [Micromonospora sp. KC213]